MIKTTKSYVAAVAAAALLLAASSTSSEDVLRPELSGLTPLIGEWSGAGWVLERGGEKQHFDSSELVEARIDGHVLLIEGKHTAADGPQKGDVVLHAMAFVSWDDTEKRVRFDSFVKDRGRSDFTGRFDGQRFVWGQEQGEGHRFRYTIDLSVPDAWNEIGEFSMDGEQWTQFFEMRLTRTR